jgi:hypothetical protein
MLCWILPRNMITACLKNGISYPIQSVDQRWRSWQRCWKLNGTGAPHRANGERYSSPMEWRATTDRHMFEFGGRWPMDPFQKNHIVAMTNRTRPATRQMISGDGPSPKWIARFYKAICGVWLHQEIVNFCNIMHW